MTISDDDIMAALESGRFIVDGDGAVWRCHRLTRTGRHIRVAPYRADPIHDKGYRRVQFGRRGTVAAHRMVWMASKGRIPAGFEVNHKNLDKSDNRIENLELLTHVGNIHHAIAAGSWPDAPYGEASGRCTLSDAAVLDIRRRRLAGEIARTIAADHGTSVSNVYHVTKRTWPHLPPEQRR